MYLIVISLHQSSVISMRAGDFALFTALFLSDWNSFWVHSRPWFAEWMNMAHMRKDLIELEKEVVYWTL